MKAESIDLNSVPTNVKSAEPIVSGFYLEQNYPNPFNPSTVIKYTIPNVIANEVNQSQQVVLKVFDILGNEVTTLVNEEKPAGTYEVKFHSIGLTSGVYFYKLSVSASPSQDEHAGPFTETKKMILLR